MAVKSRKTLNQSILLSTASEALSLSVQQQ